MPSKSEQSENKPKENKDEKDPAANSSTPAEDAKASSNDGDNESVAHEETKKASDPGSDDYNPYNDPDVPSSAIADQIAIELQSGKKSSTLKAIKDAKKNDDK